MPENPGNIFPSASSDSAGLIAFAAQAIAQGWAAQALSSVTLALPQLGDVERPAGLFALAQLSRATGAGEAARLHYYNGAVAGLAIGDRLQAIEILAECLEHYQDDLHARVLQVRILRDEAANQTAANPDMAAALTDLANNLDFESKFLKEGRISDIASWWNLPSTQEIRDSIIYLIYSCVVDAIEKFDSERVVFLFSLGDGRFSSDVQEVLIKSALWYCIHGAQPDFVQNRLLLDRWWRDHAVARVDAVSPLVAAGDPIQVPTDRPLRIGFLDGVGMCRSLGYYNMIMSKSLRVLSESGIETFFYVGGSDPIPKIVQEDVKFYRFLGNYQDPVAAIAQDDLDVLLLIDGYQPGHSLKLLAAHPAKRQAIWLHTQSSYGPELFDAIIPDARTVSDFFYDLVHEPVILPEGRSYLWNPPESAPAIAQAPRHERGSITFGVFNRATKISPRTASIWSAILQAIPDARLFLANHLYHFPGWRDAVGQMLQDAGIDPQRIAFAPFAASAADHLALYQHVDITLDTFPYNGGVTLIEGLWQGVPMVSLMDQTPLGRTSYMTLPDIGLRDLVVDDEAAYVQTACALAADGPRLDHLRANLRAMMMQSPLMNPAGFADRFEQTMRQVLALPCRRLRRG